MSRVSIDVCGQHMSCHYQTHIKQPWFRKPVSSDRPSRQNCIKRFYVPLTCKITLHLLAFISAVLLMSNIGYAASGRILAEADTPAIDPRLSNVIFRTLDSGPVIGANGTVAFTARLIDGVGGSMIDTSNDHSLWIGTQDDILGIQLRMAIQENDPAPGTEAGVVFGDVNGNATQLIVGDNGSVMIETIVKGTGVTTANDSGLWLITPDGTVTLITREGSAFSNSNSVWNWSFVESVGNGPFLALYAIELVSGNPGIWRWSPLSGFELVALQGNPAPTAFPGCTYGSISRPVINRQGQIAFDASLSGSAGVSCPPTVFRWSSGGDAQAVVSFGDPVPNFPAGAEFGSFVIGANNVDPKINDAGDILFANRLAIPSGPSSLAGRNSLWVAKSNGDLALAMVENQLLPGSTTDLLNSPGINRFALSASGIVTVRTSDTSGANVILSGTPTTSYNFTTLDDFGTNGLELIARVGELEPGTGIVFDNLHQSLINSSGKLAFTMYNGAGVPTAHWTGLNANNLELIARIGDPMDFGGVPRTLSSLSNTSLAEAGEVGGTGNSDGLPSQLSDTGQVVFRANLADPNNNAIVLYPQDPEPDTDSDGILDSLDNCIERSNPDQRDTDDDGYGNICDADLNNSGTVDFGDYSLFRSAFGNTTNPDADFDGDGAVNFGDYSIFRAAFGKAPGPSCCVP
jgi:hypothetical protein